MNPVQTGIAVALALTVVSVFFIFPGILPFGGSAEPTSATTDTTTITEQSSPTFTMPTENVTELQIKDEKVGTGVAAQAGDTVTVNYVGKLTNGTIFDASAKHGQSFSFKLGGGQVIKGWDQGLVGMKEGGKRILVIPASMAYGDQAIGNIIPANSTLVFEVELVKVTR